MIWFLVVITLNLGTIPVQIHNAEIIGNFPSEQACAEKHKEFFDKLRENNQEIPDEFNLGCVGFDGVMS